jgi:hypothetical protein
MFVKNFTCLRFRRVHRLKSSQLEELIAATKLCALKFNLASYHEVMIDETAPM